MISYIVNCPSCGTGNRIPAKMEGKCGRCGNCQAELPPMYCNPQQLSDSSFDKFISEYPGPILTEFWAPW